MAECLHGQLRQQPPVRPGNGPKHGRLSTDKVRLAVIGTGFAWERLHWPALQELRDCYEIVAVCDIDRQKAALAAQKIGLSEDRIYTDYKEMLNRQDIDAVDVIVPIELNYEVSEAVARTGRNIICEKPLAPDMEQARRARELPAKYGIKVMIAENYRYNEENNILRDLVNNQEIGRTLYFIRNDVSCFRCQMVKDTFAATEWRQHPEYAGGDFLDAALHDIAATRHIFGAVEKVQAFGRPQEMDFSPYRSIHAGILFKSGVIGQFSYFPSGKEVQRPLIGTRIFGDRGQIYLEEKTCGIINVFYNDGGHKMIPYQPLRGYYNEFRNFYQAMQGQELIGVTPEIEYGDVRMVFAILRSIAESRIVSVDTADEYMMAGG